MADDVVPDDQTPSETVGETDESDAAASDPEVAARVEPAVLADSPLVPPPMVGDSAVAGGVRPPAETDAGRVVGGTVHGISADEIDLVLDDGRPAVIHRRNFDADGTDPTTAVTIGDRLEGAVLSREDPKNRVVLSRTWAQKKQAWKTMRGIAERKDLVDGTVVGVSKRGVVVEAGGLRGFVPSSHLELTPPENLKAFVGQQFPFRVLELDLAKERLVLSRRALLMKEQRKVVHDLLTSLVVGEERTGVVSSLAEYGAFVELGGLTGLVHVSELAWGRVQRPGDVLTVGQEVTVKVLDVKVKRKRVSLSIRQLAPDPIAQIEVDSIMVGPVTRLVDFGAFVDLGGTEGLVHLSELAEHRVFTPEEVVSPGEQVRVKVLKVDKRRRRVELSIRRAVSG